MPTSWRDIPHVDPAARAAELEATGLRPAMARQAAIRQAHDAGFVAEELFLSQTQDAGPISPEAAGWLTRHGYTT